MNNGGAMDASEHNQPTASFEEGFLKQIFELWLNPEIKKRQSTGAAETPLFLYAAQVLFPTDAGTPTVRLNDEIRGYARTKANRDVKKGEAVFLHDLFGIVEFELGKEDIDCGHVTIHSTGDGGWFIAFNFMRQRGYCLGLLELAKGFLTTAKFANAEGLTAVTIDNLYSASELCAKANLLVHSVTGAHSKTHGSIHSSINNWGKLGNVSSEFVRTFNLLSQLRSKARYSATIPGEGMDEEAVRIVANEIERLHRSCKSSFDTES